MELTFQEFLQLLRRFTDDQSHLKVKRQKEAAQRCGFNSEEVARYREIFTEYDTEDHGALSLVEMRKLLRTLGLPLDHSGQEMLKGYFNKADEDQSGSLDFAEFLVLMSLLTTVNFAGIDQAAQDVLDKATTFDASRGMEKVLTAPRRAVSVPRRAVFEEGKSAL